MKNNNIFFILIIIISLLVILPTNSISSFGITNKHVDGTTILPEYLNIIQIETIKTENFTLSDVPEYLNIICIGGGGSGCDGDTATAGKDGTYTVVTIPGDDVVKANGGKGGSFTPANQNDRNIGALGGTAQQKATKNNFFTVSNAGGGGQMSGTSVNGNGGGAGRCNANGTDGDALIEYTQDIEDTILVTNKSGEGFVTIGANVGEPPYYGVGYGYGGRSGGGGGGGSGGGGGGYTSYSLPTIINVNKGLSIIPTGEYKFNNGTGGDSVGTGTIVNKSGEGGPGYSSISYSYAYYLLTFKNQSTTKMAKVITNSSLSYYIKPNSIYVTYLLKNKDYNFSVNSGLTLDLTKITMMDKAKTIIITDNTKTYNFSEVGMFKVSFINNTINNLSEAKTLLTKVTIKKSNSETLLYVISKNEISHYLTNGTYTISIDDDAFILSPSGKNITKDTNFTISAS